MNLAHLLAVPTLLATIAAVACTTADDGAADDGVATSADALTGSVSVGAALTTTARVNLREQASVNSRSLGLLPDGTEVTAVDATPSGAFYHVDRGGEVGWIHGAYLRAGSGGGSGSAGTGDFDGRSFSGVTLLWQGDWNFLVRCDSYSRDAGRVVFFCDESPSRSFVDEGNWIAVPRTHFSRSLCNQEARVCNSDRCVTAKIVEKSETTGKWEGSKAVMNALGVEVGFDGCSSSFGSATGVSVTFR